MNPEGYSLKEVMEQRFDSLEDHLIDIKEQVKRTNGRVGILESHKSYLWGACSAIVFLGGVLMYLAGQTFENKIDKAVEKSVAEAFLQGEITGVELRSK